MTILENAYTQALYSLAQQENQTKHILQELSALEESFRQVPEFLHLLASPNISKQERFDILDQSFSRDFHPYVVNFLKVLTKNGHISCFLPCCQGFRAQYQQEHNLLPVTAVTAVSLTDGQKQKLCQTLSAITGKEILLENPTDPRVLGGIRLDYDGKRLEDTVQHRLESIRTALKSTTL